MDGGEVRVYIVMIHEKTKGENDMGGGKGSSRHGTRLLYLVITLERNLF